MKIRFTLLPLCCLLLAAAPASAQKEARSMLWRISGKGMNKPSYLFGTFHLRLKTLFNFPDSLYTAIEHTDVFALEFNFDSVNAGLSDYMGRIIDKETEKERSYKNKDKTLKELLTKAELKLLKENMAEGSNINPDELTVKQIYLMKDKFIKHRTRKDDMPTFMDAFLYTIARDKGKQIGGLEQLEDQLRLVENATLTDVDPKKVLEIFKMGESAEDQMVELYLAKDLEKLKKISSIFNPAAEDALLTKRNLVMLHSMDSIMHGKSLFAAVGALHLVGKGGLINMLREKGYTVEPVICETTTNGSEYKYAHSGGAWQTIISEKDGYSIKMPGTPSDVDASGGVMKMKMYTDMTTSSYYLVSHIPKPESSPATTESVIEEMQKAMVKSPKDLEVSELESQGLKGKEFFFTDKDEMHYHIQLLGSNTDVYMMMAYGKSWSIGKADSFFNSFRLINKSKTVFINRKFGDIRATVRVPDYKPTRSVTFSGDSSQKQIMYTITDPVAGGYYFVCCVQTTLGYNNVKNDVWPESLKATYKEMHVDVKTTPTTYGLFNADRFETSEFKGAKVKGLMIYAGNRVYKISAQTAATEQGTRAADSFLQSIDVHPVSPAAMETQTVNGTFTIAGPAPYNETGAEEETGYLAKTQHTYRSWDTTSLVNYSVLVKHLSSFYWISNDTVSFKKWLEAKLTASDSTPHYTYYTENGMKCGEAIARKKNTQQWHKLKVVLDGRTRYILDGCYPDWLKENSTINEFYASLKIIKKDPTQVQTSADLFIAVLHSNDTAVFNKAKKSKNEVVFSKEDLPVLLQQINTSFPDDSEKYNTAGGFILEAINGLGKYLPLDKKEELYQNKMIQSRGQQFNVLTMMLNDADTNAAIKKAVELLLAAPPKKGYAYLFSMELKRHPQQAAAQFPALLQLAGDSVCGNTVCMLANHLIDSGYLTLEKLKTSFPIIIEKSKQQRQGVAGSAYYMLTLLAKLNTTEAWEEVRQYQFSRYNYVVSHAVNLLCEHDMAPDAKAIDSLAADKFSRISIYELLTSKNLMQLYPKKYLTQQYFAESYMSDHDEDDNYSSVISLGVKKAMYKGRMQKFYLYEMRTDYADDKPLLGVVGPFSDNNEITTINEESNAVGIYSEPLDKRNLDTQLKLYLIKRKLGPAPPQRELDDN